MRTFLMATAAFTTVLAMPAIAKPITGAQFVAKAGASDLYERQSSQLVMTSTNPAVRSFATQMVADHTQSTADVKAAAVQARLKVAPPRLEPMQAKNIAALRAASGTDRDTLYVTQQKLAHDQALALHRGYAADGTVVPLKMAASKIAPTVEHHRMMLDAM